MIVWEQVLLRLLLASLFGALIGLERERRELFAGLRTHMMVCVGSCLVMIVSAYGFSDILREAHVSLDPSRVAAQVVSGIGFIGAGTILFSKQGTVRGLTTAAGLWTVAAIGLATGGGLYFAAAATTVIALVILWAIHPLAHLLVKKNHKSTLKVVTASQFEYSALVALFPNNLYNLIDSLQVEKSEGSITYTIKFENINQIEIEKLFELLKVESNVLSYHWM